MLHYHSEEDGCELENIYCKSTGSNPVPRLYQVKCLTHNQHCWTNGWEVGWMYGTRSREVYNDPEDYQSRCGQYEVEHSFGLLAQLIRGLTYKPVVRKERTADVRRIRRNFIARGNRMDLFDILEDLYQGAIQIDGKCKGFSDIRRYLYNKNQ